MNAYQVKNNHQVLGTIGDVNPVDYDGGQILAIPGQEAEVEWLERQNDEDDNWDLYRVVLDKEEDIEDRFGADFIASVCSSCDVTLEDLQGQFVSDDPCERAQAYWSLALCWGWHEFDSYPLSFSGKQGRKLLKKRFDC